MIACQTKTFERKKPKYCATFDHLREEIYSLLFGCSNRCCFHWTLFLVFYKVEIASYMISTKLRTKAFRLVNKHKYLALNVKNGHYFYVVTFESLSFFAKLTFQLLIARIESAYLLFSSLSFTLSIHRHQMILIQLHFSFHTLFTQHYSLSVKERRKKQQRSKENLLIANNSQLNLLFVVLFFAHQFLPFLFVLFSFLIKQGHNKLFCYIASIG